MLFCWAVACALPFLDEADRYDLRFQMRGPQPVSKEIVLVYFNQDDWDTWNGSSNRWMRSLKETAVPTDSYFWRASTWNQLLAQILVQDPRLVGVSFFFNPALPQPDEKYESLRDSRVLWAGQLDNEGRPALPLMANSYGYNVGLVDFREDEDRILRRFSTPLAPIAHMAQKLAEGQRGDSSQQLNALLGETKLINFRGHENSYPSVSALSVLEGRTPENFFRGKIVIIGSQSLPSQQYQTPVGPMTRAELLAEVTDNVMNKRWIQRVSPGVSAIYLLAILALTVLIMSTYPQAAAIVFLIWLGLGIVALSIWVFDTFYIWLPAVSALAVGMMAYVIFLGYQLSRRENQTWRLQREKQLLSELDQLRNNFVSLISHDLKTPIAKIQAVCDRLMAGAVPENIREGLGTVRAESAELHRYIQSILQLSRLESNTVKIHKEATDLNEVVERVVGQIQSLAQDKRQDVHMSLEPLFSIEVDSVLIQEVVLNLVENAVKYTPNDGRIEVKTQELDDKVVFSVNDNGPGIPVEDRHHIFEKFFRGQASKSKIKGTGLGLFLVKYFIELHGGEVFLESDVGKGTRVGFALPLQA
jgi:signal transduction histidine kinase